MSTHVTVGVDVGGTSAKIGIVSAANQVLARGDVATGSIEPEPLAQAIADEARRLAAEGSMTIDAVGVGCAGLVDVEEGVVRVSPNLPSWRDAPFRRLLRETTGSAVELLNDANAFAYAEGRHGPGRGTRVGVYVTLGTGVGGAILLDGDLFVGARGMAGEIGHMSVDAGGPRCLCGGRGCLETYVGIAPIAALAERKIRSGAPGAAIRRAAGGADAVITPKAIAEAAAAGDWTALAVYADVGEVLGTAMASVANLLDPDIIVIGGGVAQAGDVLFEPARGAYDRQAIAPADIRAALVPASFGADAGLIGAATFARDRG